MHATLFCAPLSLSLHTSKSLIHKYTYIFRLIVSLLLLLRQINKLLACSRNLAQCFWKWREKFYRKRKINIEWLCTLWMEWIYTYDFKWMTKCLKLKWSQRSNLSNYILREKRDREKKWNVSSSAYSYYYSYYYYC